MAEDGASVAVNDQPHGIDLERLFACPQISLFIAEYPKSKDDPYYRIWNKYARQYRKKYINLFDANMIYPPEFRQVWQEWRRDTRKKMPEFAGQLRQDLGVLEKNLVALFVSAGVDIDTDGYACCGLGDFNQWTYPAFMKDRGGPVNNGVWRVWQALARKYYNFGTMDLNEADKIIETIKKNQVTGKIDPEKRKAVILAAEKIIIDGKNDDWDFTSAPSVNTPEQASQFKGWRGPSDASFQFQVAADQTKLYFGILVKDDVLVLKNQLDSCPRSPWADEMNMYLTTVDIREAAGVWREKNAQQLRLLPGEKQIWHTQAAPIAGSNVAWQKTDDGYFIEGQVPWRYFGFQPAPGMWLGLEAQMLDADSATAGCRGSLLWNSKGKPEPANWGIGIIGK